MTGPRDVPRRTVLIGTGALVTAPSFVGVAVGQTASGNVELTADATLPANTQVLIEIFEDTNADGTADNTQELSIDDGTNTYEFDQLSGETDEGVIYWIDVQLSTTDEDVTPEVDSLSISLPGAPPPTTEEPQPPGDSAEIDLPMEISFRDMETGISIFLIGILGVSLGAAVTLRNWAAGVVWGIAVILLLYAGLFGVGLEMFWLAMIVLAVLLVAGMIIRGTA